MCQIPVRNKRQPQSAVASAKPHQDFIPKGPAFLSIKPSISYRGSFYFLDRMLPDTRIAEQSQLDLQIYSVEFFLKTP